MKGDIRERELSRGFHSQGVPLLVSPLLLRSLGAGQIDLARFQRKEKEWCIQIVEVKTQPIISRRQKMRLKKSAIFLGQIFGCSIEQVICFLNERP